MVATRPDVVTVTVTCSPERGRTVPPAAKDGTFGARKGEEGTDVRPTEAERVVVLITALGLRSRSFGRELRASFVLATSRTVAYVAVRTDERGAAPPS